MNVVKMSVLRGVAGIAGVAMLLCTAAAVNAQTKDVTIPARTWAVKLGAFFPSNGNLKGQAGDPFWAAGVDYHPNLTHHTLGGDVHFGLDADWRSSKAGGAHSISISAKLIWPITPSDSKMRVWGGLGPGLYFISTPFLGETVQGGAKFIVGLDLTERLFAEVNYDYVGRFSDRLGNGLAVDGLTVAAGYRF